jgi:hypothetical protein
MEQLDEHLSGAVKYSPPSFIQIGSTLFIYFIILIVSFISYYAIFESFGLFNLLDQIERYSDLPVYSTVIILVLESIVVLSNYYLQGRLYNLLNQSVVKTVLIPILLWITIIVAFVLYDPYLGGPNSGIFIPFIRISSLIIWYSILSLIIAFYLKHQDKIKYYAALFAYWLFSILITSLLP